jgi:hypothetical protein
MSSFDIRFTSNDPTARFSWLPSAVASGFNPRCAKRNTARSNRNSAHNRNPAHTLISQQPSGEPQQPSNSIPVRRTVSRRLPCRWFYTTGPRLPCRWFYTTGPQPAQLLCILYDPSQTGIQRTHLSLNNHRRFYPVHPVHPCEFSPVVFSSSSASSAVNHPNSRTKKNPAKSSVPNSTQLATSIRCFSSCHSR